MNDLQNIKWIAEWNGRPNLAKVDLIGVTEKTFSAQKIKDVIGWQYFGTRNKKSSYVVIFDNPAEAIHWLIHNMSINRTALLAQANQLAVDMDRYTELISMLESGSDVSDS
jgi:hypothetical protein